MELIDKKEFISFLKGECPYYCTNTVKRKEWIAWLEKQGEQKPVEWSEEDENLFNL